MPSSPAQSASVARLRAWAVSGPGRALFNWGAPGDFDRCRSFYRGKLPAQMIDGWCANLHKMATGQPPGKA